MYAYVYLLFAILAEILATSGLKLTEGFSKLIPTILVLTGYGIAFYLLSLTLRDLPVSIVYAIWSGIGIVGIAIIGFYFFKEPFGIWHLVGTTLILVGVIILNLVTNAH